MFDAPYLTHASIIIADGILEFLCSTEIDFFHLYRGFLTFCMQLFNIIPETPEERVFFAALDLEDAPVLIRTSTRVGSTI